MSVILRGLESLHTTAFATGEVGWRLFTVVYKTGSDPVTGALAHVSAPVRQFSMFCSWLSGHCTFVCIVTVLVRFGNVCTTSQTIPWKMYSSTTPYQKVC